MHVVIMGCGRVGSLLAVELEAKGHSVAVIDQSKEAFRRLGPDFKGRTVTGVGFDRNCI
jgi:trk system potassium uptake protein TrkA